MTPGSFGLGLLLAAVLIGSSAAQDAASVMLVAPGGTVCVGGTDVVWVAEQGKVMRWRQNDGVVSEIQMPDLDHIDMARGAILGCLVRSDGVIDLYYEEYFNIPGTRRAPVGWDENRRVQTVWLSGSRHRALLTISVPEGGHVDDTIRIVPELGVTLHGLTVERVSDGLQYKVEIPDGAYPIGIWPISRTWPVEPPDLVLCYGYRENQKTGGCVAIRVGAAAMAQRPLTINAGDIGLMNWQYMPLEAERRCALKSPASFGYAGPDHAGFDCFDPYKVFAWGQTTIFPMARYPVANGYVAWRTLHPGRVCRQRSIGADALIIQAQCYRIEGQEFAAALSVQLTKGLLAGHEYPATSGWTMTLVSRDVSRPITGRLLPVND